MNTNLIETLNFLLAHLGTNTPPEIATTHPVAWSSYATAFNVVLVGGGFMFRHVVGWWLTAGGWAGIKQKFLHGNQPATTIPKNP